MPRRNSVQMPEIATTAVPQPEKAIQNKEARCFTFLEMLVQLRRFRKFRGSFLEPGLFDSLRRHQIKWNLMTPKLCPYF